MKFTVVFITLLSISSSWAVLAKRIEDLQNKREAQGYSSQGHSSGGYPSQALGHGDVNAINVGAGYSIGGQKLAYNFGGQESSAPLQLSSGHLPSGGQTIQLAPITLQPNHGGSISQSDFSQLMSQLSQGGLSLTPANNIAEFHTSQIQGGHGGQELSIPQYAFPKFQQYSLAAPVTTAQGSTPAYAAGTKGLSSYGSTGPVLFTPETQGSSAGYSFPSSGHSFGSSGALSLGSSGQGLSGLSFGGSGHSLGGGSVYSLGGGSGHSLGSSSGPSLGGASGNLLGGYSYGGASGHSLGGSIKGLSGSYAAPSKGSFKPSAYLGSSVQGDTSHGLSASSEQYSAPSFGALSTNNHGAALSSGDHGASYGGSFGGFSGGSNYKLVPAFESVKGESLGAPLDAVASFSSSGHFGTPSGNSYSFPSSSYSSSVSHAASSTRPHYVSSPKHSSSSFGEGSSSFRGPASSQSSFASGPKYSYGGHSSSRYSSPRDSHGAHSETVYNTIKYSEELKPRGH